MRIVSLDPGGTTGVALYQGFDHKPDPNYIIGAQLGPEDHHETLWDLLEHENPEKVICERFMYQRRDITKGVSLSLASVEYIGVTKLWCAMNNVDLIIQTPAQAKNLWTDDKLKTLELWQKGMPHANDAVRHLLYYLVVSLNRKEWLEKLRV